jgi:hypothetical protein
MRRYLSAALVCTSAAAALGKPVTAPSDKPKPIDLKAVIDRLDVFKDDVGNYYVLPRPDGQPIDDDHSWVFYGDGKSLYEQRIIGSSVNGDRYEWYVWAPRAKGINTGIISRNGDKLTIACRQKDEGHKITLLNADEAKTLIRRATFLPQLWQHSAHFLARDDDGVYYYVDELREEFGGNGFRVYIGQKGAMKAAAMTNIVSDSAGEIFATKSGQLKIIAGKNDTAAWIKGGKKAELTVLPLNDNRYLIYRDLGIYGQLGTVCDDL